MAGRQDTSTEVPACWVCVAGGFPECCIPDEHTETVIRLAQALGQSLAGPPGNPEDHPEWYIEDAAACVELGAQEGAKGWVIEHDGECLGEFFKINGLEFYVDMNAEVFNTPVLAADHRSWLAEEASWDEDE